MKLGSVFILFVALSPYFCYGKNINISEIKNAINLCNGVVIDKRTQTSLKQTIQHHYDNDGYVFYQIMNISSRSGDIIAITQDYSFPNHIIGFIVKKIQTLVFLMLLRYVKKENALNTGTLL